MSCCSVAYIPNTSIRDVLSFVRQNLGGGNLYDWDEKFHCRHINISRFDDYKDRKEKICSIFIYWTNNAGELRETEEQLGLPKGLLFLVIRQKRQRIKKIKRESHQAEKP